MKVSSYIITLTINHLMLVLLQRCNGQAASSNTSLVCQNNDACRIAGLFCHGNQCVECSLCDVWSHSCPSWCTCRTTHNDCNINNDDSHISSLKYCAANTNYTSHQTTTSSTITTSTVGTCRTCTDWIDDLINSNNNNNTVNSNETTGSSARTGDMFPIHECGCREHDDCTPTLSDINPHSYCARTLPPNNTLVMSSITHSESIGMCLPCSSLINNGGCTSMSSIDSICLSCRCNHRCGPPHSTHKSCADDCCGWMIREDSVFTFAPCNSTYSRYQLELHDYMHYRPVQWALHFRQPRWAQYYQYHSSVSLHSTLNYETKDNTRGTGIYNFGGGHGYNGDDARFPDTVPLSDEWNECSLKIIQVPASPDTMNGEDMIREYYQWHCNNYVVSDTVDREWVLMGEKQSSPTSSIHWIQSWGYDHYWYYSTTPPLHTTDVILFFIAIAIVFPYILYRCPSRFPPTPSPSSLSSIHAINNNDVSDEGQPRTVASASSPLSPIGDDNNSNNNRVVGNVYLPIAVAQPVVFQPSDEFEPGSGVSFA